MGGSSSGIFVFELAKALSDIIEVEVIAPDHTRKKAINTTPFRLSLFQYAPRKYQTLAHTPGGIPVALKKSRWNILLVPPFLLSMLFKVLWHSTRSDIIQANWSISGFISCLAGFLTRTPVITTIRGEDATRAKHSTIDDFILKFCIANSAFTVTVNESFKKILQDKFPQHAQKIHFIPNGVSDNFFIQPSQRNQFSRPALLSIGSLIPRKGHRQIIEALSIIPPQIRPTLTIVGGGVEREALEKLIEKYHLIDDVTLTGAINPTEIKDFYKNADIFILSSHSEGRPNVILEAMAASLPVIATNIAGTNELAVDNVNALLYEPENIQQLAACITRLSEDIEFRKKLGDSGKHFILEHNLTWKKTAEKYLELMKVVIN